MTTNADIVCMNQESLSVRSTLMLYSLAGRAVVNCHGCCPSVRLSVRLQRMYCG